MKFLIAPACTESAFTVHTGMRIYPNFNHGLNVHMLEEHYFAAPGITRQATGRQY